LAQALLSNYAETAVETDMNLRLITILAALTFSMTASANPFVKHTSKALTHMTKGLLSCSQLKLDYANGNGYTGWTFIKVEGNTITVRQTRPGQQDVIHSGTLSTEDCHKMAKLSVEGKLWNVRPARKYGKPDETMPRITVGVRGIGTFMVSQWTTDVKKTPAFGTVQKAILKVAHRLSRQQVKKAASKTPAKPSEG